MKPYTFHNRHDCSVKYLFSLPLTELTISLLGFLFPLRMLHIPAYAPNLILYKGLSTGFLIQIT
jgi:hypothetical protein